MSAERVAEIEARPMDLLRFATAGRWTTASRR